MTDPFHPAKPHRRPLDRRAAGQPLASAIDGAAIHHTHAEAIDFGEALDLRPAHRRPGAARRSTSSSARRA